MSVKQRFLRFMDQVLFVPRSLLIVWLLLAFLGGMVVHALDPDQLTITITAPEATP